MKVTFLGGGALAVSVGTLMSSVGHNVVLGLRSPGKGTALGFNSEGFVDAISDADLVVIALPFYVVKDVLPSLSQALNGKIVIDATNPVDSDWQPILTGELSSGAEQIAALLPGSIVVKAFNAIFADVIRPERLNRNGQTVTLFVAGDDDNAKGRVLELGKEIGFDPVNAGPLKSARYLEAMAHLNIELAVGQNGGTDAAYLYSRG